MSDFTEDELLQFQCGVLNLIQNIKRSRIAQSPTTTRSFTTQPSDHSIFLPPPSKGPTVHHNSGELTFNNHHLIFNVLNVKKLITPLGVIFKLQKTMNHQFMI
uniref:Uncharacterized protein n=1 Tax=Clastoptera arizonana TaxID=38151 RepID=A0A1B6C620_9HEMI